MPDQDSWRKQVEQQLADLQSRVAELDKRLAQHEGRKREKYPHG
jgi:uncharacterized protein YceH (UPF0502 family)